MIQWITLRDQFPVLAFKIEYITHLIINWGQSWRHFTAKADILRKWIQTPKLKFLCGWIFYFSFSWSFQDSFQSAVMGFTETWILVIFWLELPVVFWLKFPVVFKLPTLMPHFSFTACGISAILVALSNCSSMQSLPRKSTHLNLFSAANARPFSFLILFLTEVN